MRLKELHPTAVAMRFELTENGSLYELEEADFLPPCDATRLPESAWRYEPRSGVYVNPELSEAILDLMDVYPTPMTTFDAMYSGASARRMPRSAKEYGWDASLRATPQRGVFRDALGFVSLDSAACAQTCYRMAAPFDVLDVRWIAVELRATIPLSYGRIRHVAWYGWGMPV